MMQSTPGSRPHRTVELSSIFPGHPGDLETAWRCCADHSSVSATQASGPTPVVLIDLTGAVASLFASGLIGAGTMAYPIIITGVAVASWALRPPSRRPGYG